MPLELPARVNIADEFIARPAREHPQRLAILGEPVAVTYRDLQDWVCRVAAALRASGCAPGDRVLLALPDSLEFIAAFFGTAKIGAIAVPVNPHARAADYEYYVQDCTPRFVILHGESAAVIAPALAHRSQARAIVVDGGEPGAGFAATAWQEWLASPMLPGQTHSARTPAWEISGGDAPPFPASGRDPAFFLYTSGSGGTTKAVVHRHQDMLVTSRSFAQGVLGVNSDDRMFSVSKLFFAYGLGNGMYFPFAVGASTILNPQRPRPEKVAEILRRYRPTVFFSVPTFYAALLREAEHGLRLDFSSVRLAVSAGEALPAEVFLRCKDKFGIEVLDGIGSTEMLHMFIACRPGQARPGTCGTEVPNYRAKILDDFGASLPAGEIGNLWVSGESAFAEYWNKPELTSRTIVEGWVMTGDKFYCDAEGFYHHCGRCDDMIKVSGMWVAPVEVENALLACPGVAEAAVVGLTDALGLMRSVAFVVMQPEVMSRLRTGSQSDGALESGGAGEAAGVLRDAAQSLHQALRARLAHYKCPQEIRIVNELPKTPTGKIQRFRLRASGGSSGVPRP